MLEMQEPYQTSDRLQGILFSLPRRTRSNNRITPCFAHQFHCYLHSWLKLFHLCYANTDKL